MTRQQALKEAVKRFGSKAHVSIGQELSSPEKRQQQSERNRFIKKQREDIEADIQARLKTLPWYVELRATQRALGEELRKKSGYASYFKFSVGTNEGWCTYVKGHGDTWEEAFAMADTNAQEDRARLAARQ